MAGTDTSSLRTLRQPWPAFADAASSRAFFGFLGWAVWHLGVQLSWVTGVLESQVAACGISGVF